MTSCLITNIPILDNTAKRLSLLTDILYSGLASDLKENPFAYALFRRLIGGGEVKSTNDLSALAKITEIKSVVGYQSTVGEFKDLRARKILLKGIRRFPSNDNKYYYLDFCCSAVARSSVFLGSNGVGKSSVYAALEKIYLKRLYSSKSRGEDTVEGQIQYLKNLSAVEQDCRIILETSNSANINMIDLTDKSVVGSLSYPCFFCTEWDVETLAKGSNEDSNSYVADQLGIEDFLTILKLCDTALTEYKEIENPIYIDKLNLLEDLENKIQKISRESVTYRELERNIQELQSEIHKHENRYPSIKVSKEGMDNLRKTKDYLQKAYGTLMSRLLQYAKIVFPRLFEKYKDEDVLNISLNVEEDKRNLKILLIAKNPITNQIIKDIEPQRFLNTFRFKLYCVALKISLAFCCKSLYRINAPIVIDDVFDSSDFQNREKIKDFIHDIFQAHEEIFGKTSLQLIFFTQDEVIGDSVYQGILNFSPREGGKYSRIFNYLEVNEKEDITNHEVSYIDNTGNSVRENLVAYKIEDVIRSCR